MRLSIGVKAFLTVVWVAFWCLVGLGLSVAISEVEGAEVPNTTPSTAVKVVGDTLFIKTRISGTNVESCSWLKIATAQFVMKLVAEQTINESAWYPLGTTTIPLVENSPEWVICFGPPVWLVARNSTYLTRPFYDVPGGKTLGRVEVGAQCDGVKIQDSTMGREWQKLPDGRGVVVCERAP